MATITIKVGATQHCMSTLPAMPEITLQAVVQGGAVAATTDFNWTFALEYPDFIAIPGSRRRNVRSKQHPAMAPRKGNPVVVPFTTLMCGKLSVAVEASVNGQRLGARRDDLLVGGANPSVAELRAAIADSLLRKLIAQESGGNQFSDTGNRAWVAQALNPNWSGDNLRGVGLGQLTNPPPVDDDIWNWRSNALHLQQRFAAKRTLGTRLHTRIAASNRFKTELEALSAWRRAEGLRPRTVTLPPLNPHQLDCEGLRAYNGFGPTVAGQYLEHIHEFEPATTVLTSARRLAPNGQPLRSPPVPDIDAITGQVQWVQISGAERLRRYGGVRSGDVDYVANVLARPD